MQYTDENTQGYTEDELDYLNAEYEKMRSDPAYEAYDDSNLSEHLLDLFEKSTV